MWERAPCPALEHFQIGKNQLQIDRLNIPQRIDRALHMDDVRILEAADLQTRDLCRQCQGGRACGRRCGKYPCTEGARSDVKPEQYDIPVLNHIVLSLGTYQSLFLRRVEAAAFDQIVVADDLSADNTA